MRLPLAQAIETSQTAPSSDSCSSGLSICGKFICRGGEKLYLRGVTYGPFCPDESGNEYGHPQTVEQDFRQMIQHGINAVRTYTVPPRWLLDLAAECGLLVMVGLPWEQHITFLDDERTAKVIEAK